jgi:hypothetical protein
MNLPQRLRNPRTMMRIGMVFLVLALLWPRFIPVTANLGPDAIDGLRGLLFGLAIGSNLLSLGLQRRARCE